MDALKTIAASSLKAETPKFNIGDTIKVGVNIREGERKEFRCSKEQLLLRRAAALLRPSQ